LEERDKRRPSDHCFYQLGASPLLSDPRWKDECQGEALGTSRHLRNENLRSRIPSTSAVAPDILNNSLPQPSFGVHLFRLSSNRSMMSKAFFVAIILLPVYGRSSGNCSL
jgi:hypothetical protein